VIDSCCERCRRDKTSGSKTLFRSTGRLLEPKDCGEYVSLIED